MTLAPPSCVEYVIILAALSIVNFVGHFETTWEADSWPHNIAYCKESEECIRNFSAQTLSFGLVKVQKHKAKCQGLNQNGTPIWVYTPTTTGLVYLYGIDSVVIFM
jgi:hypothetical protein